MKLFERIREDTCIFCGANRSIELYDKNDYPIRFSFILDTNKFILLNNREIHYGKCKCCGREFLLDWRNDNKIPTPLLDINFRLYMQQYSKSKVV